MRSQGQTLEVSGDGDRWCDWKLGTRLCKRDRLEEQLGGENWGWIGKERGTKSRGIVEEKLGMAGQGDWK